MSNQLYPASKQNAELLDGIGESLRRFGNSQELLQKVLDTIPQTVFWKDVNLNYLGCNQLFAENAGKSCPAEVIGLSDFDLPRSYDEAVSYRTCDRRVMDSGIAEIGIVETQLTANGELRWLETNKSPLHNDAGEVIGVLGTYHDITRLKRAEEGLQRDNEELERRVEERTRELKFVAHHDGLTGLANRMYFVQQLDEVLEAKEKENIALLFIDLDDFKPVNDTQGHETGDKLLMLVAKILKSVLGPDDFAGRFGGDV
jgi:PAS domain S-box-containing protein